MKTVCLAISYYGLKLCNGHNTLIFLVPSVPCVRLESGSLVFE